MRGGVESTEEKVPADEAVKEPSLLGSSPHEEILRHQAVGTSLAVADVSPGCLDGPNGINDALCVVFKGAAGGSVGAHHPDPPPFLKSTVGLFQFRAVGSPRNDSHGANDGELVVTGRWVEEEAYQRVLLQPRTVRREVVEGLNYQVDETLFIPRHGATLSTGAEPVTYLVNVFLGVAHHR